MIAWMDMIHCKIALVQRMTSQFHLTKQPSCLVVASKQLSHSWVSHMSLWRVARSLRRLETCRLHILLRYRILRHRDLFIKHLWFRSNPETAIHLPVFGHFMHQSIIVAIVMNAELRQLDTGIYDCMLSAMQSCEGRRPICENGVYAVSFTIRRGWVVVRTHSGDSDR